MKSYAVVCTYSFDDCAVYLFDTLEEATAYLKELYEEEVRIDIEENGWEVTSMIEDDCRYAKIVDHFADGDDITEYQIGSVYI